jgi:hypothetical protein
MPGGNGNDPVAQRTGPARRKSKKENLKRKIRQPAAARAPPRARARKA